jgi:ferritin
VLNFDKKLGIMLSKTIESALNKQIRIEAESSQVYLAMAVWAEVKGFVYLMQIQWFLIT